MDENFKFVFFRFFSSSLVLSRLAYARHSACRACLKTAIRQGFPLPQFFSRFSPLREKAKIGCAPHQSTSLTASPQGEALTKARITLFAEKMKFAEFFSGKRGSLETRLPIFAEKMKFTEFFSGKGKPTARITLLRGRLRGRSYPLRR